MYNIVNVVSETEWLKQYSDAEDMESFVRACACDGVEYICGGDDQTGKISPEIALGCHLLFYPNWVDFWYDNESYLLRKFGSREVWEGFYLAKDRDGLLAQYRADMDQAERTGVKYAVFHISDVSNEELLDYRWEHSNIEVIDAAAELLNELTDGRHYSFELLLENLWTPGLNLTDPSETERLLDRVHYEKKGLLLDTGHLMCTNTALTNEDEAFDYVAKMVRRHGSLASFFRGIHMHQSVTGAVARDMLSRNIQLSGDFYARFAEAYDWILKIDLHRPVSSPGAAALLELVQPEYLVHELSSPGRDQKCADVQKQMRALGLL